jgi:hypothetical protein
MNNKLHFIIKSCMILERPMGMFSWRLACSSSNFWVFVQKRGKTINPRLREILPWLVSCEVMASQLKASAYEWLVLWSKFCLTKRWGKKKNKKKWLNQKEVNILRICFAPRFSKQNGRNCSFWGCNVGKFTFSKRK